MAAPRLAAQPVSPSVMLPRATRESEAFTTFTGGVKGRWLWTSRRDVERSWQREGEAEVAQRDFVGWHGIRERAGSLVVVTGVG